MEQFNLLWAFLSPLESYKSLHRSLSELVTAKLEAPHLSIRAAKKWGILDLSTSNYIVGCYELLQDVLFTVDRYKGLNFISDFRIINHNKRHLTKQKEIIKAIKVGKIKKGSGLSSMQV
jgi:hypothetical protein